MKKTRVYIDVFYYKAALSGVKNYIEELVYSIDEFGSNDFEYIISHDLNSNNLFVNSKYRLIRWLFQLRYLLWKQVVLPLKLYLKNIDYVVCPDYLSPILTNSKKIIVIHDNLFWKYPENYPELWRKYFTFLIKLGICSKSLIVTTSNYSKDGLKQIFKKNPIFPIYQSSESLKFKIENNHKKKYILHLGTFEKRKDLLTLLKAFQQLSKNKNSDFILVLAGSKYINGNYKVLNKIENFISKNNLSDIVMMPGYVDRVQAFNLYKNAIMYVFPSVDEGFGIPLIEAMSLSIPVICSDIPIFREIGRDSVFYFKKGDSKELYEKMKIIINDKEISKILIKKGIKRAKKFNRKNFIKQFEELYKKDIAST